MPHEMIGNSLRVHLRTAYTRFERPISSASLLGGFAFDALTLKRVDAFWENFWIVAHLAVVAVCILVINRTENRGADSKDPSKAHFWFINTLQFFFGGLLSTLLVFYFRSGSLRVSWPFFLILGAAFLANERLKQHYTRLYFQISLFYLCLYCFTIFILPVVLHAIGAFIFLLSGAVSLALLYVFLHFLRSADDEQLAASRRRTLNSCIGAIFITINLLYFLNLIPPLPLSLQDASVHHAIARNAEGNYAVQSEDPGPLRFFRLRETFHGRPGAPVYAYSAVFSPTALNTKIVHEWQFYEPKRGWTTMSRIELPVRGGRGRGYRTYSVSTAITAGAWRVNVETPGGALLGRLRFNVVLQPSDPPLITQIKN
ncbi:MAG: DUF2914 domain-containing protein [Acidobacteriia bacterium]|nr:DUF2914 domain-containing protein [Terriglobia bacterium]